MAPPKRRKTTVRRKPAPPRRRAAPRSKESGTTLPVDVQPGAVDEALRKVTDTLRQWANAGRYTKVRFKFRGKPLLPDLPLAAVVAAEGLTFYWTGILRALLVNVAGRSVLDVELVNDSEGHLQKGKEELLSGEVDRAIAEFRTALAKQHDNPRAHLNLGIALKLKGDRAGARSSLEKARKLDPDGPVAREADRLLQGLEGSAEMGSPGPA
ncbi:MAG TPA: tetratricopeptide repeat protein [Myxococcaceae bacterium]|nr:tetratricopeptide repeat protein [Myxococcaceae bacterium]